MGLPKRTYTILPDLRAPVAEIPPDFLSVCIDTSLLIGGHWWNDEKGVVRGTAAGETEALDLTEEKLVEYAKLLSPAMLRIGGTEADRLHYKIKKKDKFKSNNEYEYVLKRRHWKSIHGFLEATGFTLLFTVNAGPLERDVLGNWIPQNARQLFRYSRKKGFDVAVWEFGNEVNGFAFVHGFKNRINGSQYAEDFERFHRTVKDEFPEAATAGPASAVWPVLGEINPIIPSFLKYTKVLPDIITWHYYPQQSSRGRFAIRRASSTRILKPRLLDGIHKWIRKKRRDIERRMKRESNSILKPAIWLTETGHALYGGEPSVSDRFGSSLWWMDELGLLAEAGIEKVFRQSLVGSDYGLLREKTLEPTPDFFASLLFKRLMGNKCYEIGIKKTKRKRKKLRLYMHNSARQTTPGAFMILAINTHSRHYARMKLERLPVKVMSHWIVTADSLTSEAVFLNGEPMNLELLLKSFASPPAEDIDEESTGDHENLFPLLPPRSYGFFEISIPL